MANTTGKKFGGRTKGTPNKTTQEMRDFMRDFLSRKFEKLDEVFDQLEPKEKINALLKMLPYLVPKQMQMDLTATQKQEQKQDLSKLTDAELHTLIELTDKVQTSKN
ncbi:hypothetical protein [Aequorivita viscosa]|uniref:Uncharacterized protein n=1 Tax=Aequorivita viscosa TaxID=797419 RepID=A0A1M6KKF8_9FLAO|nr:hypothetical protein [Aequorivita viscosa]SDX19314.1 hypothetical protein SAMN05216556_1208 [Aequorivita viscosa]SHJ59415.1 hypothetical protein SAMN04487908_12064 [Aequorivita viscosa]